MGSWKQVAVTGSGMTQAEGSAMSPEQPVPRRLGWRVGPGGQQGTQDTVPRVWEQLTRWTLGPGCLGSESLPFPDRATLGKSLNRSYFKE